MSKAEDAMTQKVLLRAAELIDQGWCQWRFAEDKGGHSVAATSSGAVRWCLVGSLNRATVEVLGSEVEVRGVLRRAALLVGARSER